MPVTPQNAPESSAPADGTTERPVVLVTGASRGIGRAVARELGPDHHLVLGVRRAEDAADLRAELPSAEVLVAELTDPEAVAAAVRGLALPRGLDGLVHSAGNLVMGRVDELEPAEWERSFALNVTAVADLTRHLLPALRLARGTVVTLNSGSGFTSIAARGPYCASKFALRALTDALREEERPHGVRVSSVHPGRVDTDMQRELRTAEGDSFTPAAPMSPETVAATIGLALRLPADANLDVVSVRPR